MDTIASLDMYLIVNLALRRFSRVDGFRCLCAGRGRFGLRAGAFTFRHRIVSGGFHPAALAHAGAYEYALAVWLTIPARVCAFGRRSWGQNDVFYDRWSLWRRNFPRQ